MSDLHHYLGLSRVHLFGDGADRVRAVMRSDVVREPEGHEPFEHWMSGRVPLFYRPPEAIARSFEGASDFRQPLRETLLRLPTAQGFQQSHFAEILAGVFCQRMLGLELLYSKLSLLSAEDSNAHKMDLLLYARTPAGDVRFVFAEVKSSMKCGPQPASHHRGCFKALFDSFGRYRDQDRDFDLAVIADRMESLPAEDRDAVRAALRPDVDLDLSFAGVCVIDSSTHRDAEADVLARRQSAKDFDVELLTVAELPAVAEATWMRLQALRGLV